MTEATLEKVLPESPAATLAAAGPVRVRWYRRLLRNRLAQNELVASFCRREGIAFLDLTPDLSRVAAQGENVYFPDDSHWNARGHQVAAGRLALFLAR